MKNNILNELGDSLDKYGNPHMTNFDKDKWQWNDTKRINEQEKRITQLIEESNEHKRAIISLSKKVETLLGQSRWDLREFAKKALLDDVVEKFDILSPLCSFNELKMEVLWDQTKTEIQKRNIFPQN